MIYAIDFDGTLAHTRFPEILGPKEKMVELAKLLKKAGNKIILWTCRCGEDLEAAVKWCEEQGVVFDAVNEPLPEQKEAWGNDTRKIYADVYIDDKAINIDQAESVTDILRGALREIKK